VSSRPWTRPGISQPQPTKKELGKNRILRPNMTKPCYVMFKKNMGISTRNRQFEGFEVAEV
jgi:hypothetical protein